MLASHILCFECFQNKFYIESKLNRDLRDDLMKLFADHVAERHVNTLMRECVASCEALIHTRLNLKIVPVPVRVNLG